MPLPVASAWKVAKAVAPTVGPEVAKVAKNLAGNRQFRRRAHDMAWERNGRVGQVTFTDGQKRWVVVDSSGVPIASVPPFGDASREALSTGLAGVDFDRCMNQPDRDVKEQRRQQDEERKSAKAQANVKKQVARKQRHET
jgi:hypothetical protein